MSSNALHKLAGHILLNSQARQSMLNGNQEAILRQFDLNREERQALSELRAESLASLLATLEWLAKTGAAEEESSSRINNRIGVRSQQLIFR